MNPFKNILYVVEDASLDDTQALARAVSLAENNQGRLHLLRATEPPRLGPFAGSLTTAQLEERVRQRETLRMESLLAPHHGRVEATCEVVIGKDFLEVIREVLRNGRDLVIKAAGASGLRDAVLGGADRHLLRKCPCPVWIMQPGERSNYQRILAAIDADSWLDGPVDDALDRLILDVASSLALSDFAELHVVHAWEPVADGMIRVFGSDLSDKQIAAHAEREERAHRAALAVAAEGLRQRIGDEAYAYLRPDLHLLRGQPRWVIPDLAAQLPADLVVMGTVSRTGIPGLIMGNTAEIILGRISCSVLAVKPRGFVSPVTLD